MILLPRNKVKNQQPWKTCPAGRALQQAHQFHADRYQPEWTSVHRRASPLAAFVGQLHEQAGTARWHWRFRWPSPIARPTGRAERHDQSDLPNDRGNQTSAQPWSSDRETRRPSHSRIPEWILTTATLLTRLVHEVPKCGVNHWPR